MLIQTECPTGCIRHRATQRNVPPICDGASLDTTNLKGFMTSYSEDREIYGAMEETKYLYKVVSGAVRTCRTFKDGRRQIGAFYVPGDVFGIETGDRHTLSAETTAPSKLLLINRSTLVALAARDNAIASQLWMVTALELRRSKITYYLLQSRLGNALPALLLKWHDASLSATRSNCQ